METFPTNYTLIFIAIVLVIAIYFFVTKKRRAKKEPIAGENNIMNDSSDSEKEFIQPIENTGISENQKRHIKQIPQKISSEEVFELKDLISDNKIDEALGKLKTLSMNQKLEAQLFNEVVILKSRYNHIKSSTRKGVLSHSEENLEINKVRDTLLELIDSISKF